MSRFAKLARFETTLYVAASLFIIVALSFTVRSMSAGGQKSSILDSLDQTVTVVSGDEQYGVYCFGTGVVLLGKIDGLDVNFVLTAHHAVFDHYSDAKCLRPTVVQHRGDAGQVIVGGTVVAGDRKRDVALILLDRDVFARNTKLARRIPEVFERLHHCGSGVWGYQSSNTASSGLVASPALRVTEGVTYIQSTVQAMPGSSGGGIFLSNSGECVGLLVRGYEGMDNYSLSVPSLDIVNWLTNMGLGSLVGTSDRKISERDIERLSLDYSKIF